MNLERKKTWCYEHVVDTTILPDFAVRTYLEQSDLRGWLMHISQEIDILRACDVGAGYGRLTPVLAEFAQKIVAFEREAHFVADIQRLLPQVEVRQIQRLWQIPEEDGAFQFVLSFTVLQHLTDDELVPVVHELQRIVSKPGYILLCEATDVSLRYDEDDSPEGGVTIGRLIEHYQSLFEPLHLVATTPRRTEVSYSSHRGTYMLFKNS